MGPLIAGALIGAGSQALNSMFSFAGNKSQQNYNQNQYEMQRMNAFKDSAMQNSYNMSMWNMNNAYNQEMWKKQNEYNMQLWEKQNAYNSPAAQMQRLKEAGINPQSMFGNMTNGGSIDAQQIAQASAPNAAAPRSPSVQSYHPIVPKFDPNGIMSILDARYKSAQIDNLKEQNQLLQTQGLIATLEATGKEIGNKTAGLHYDNLRETMGYSLEALKQTVLKQKQDYIISGNQELRNQEQFPLSQENLRSQIQSQAAQRKMYLSTMDIQNLEKDLKSYEITLHNAGVQTNDNIIYRIIGQMLENYKYK